jgi:hypothetical protein
MGRWIASFRLPKACQSRRDFRFWNETLLVVLGLAVARDKESICLRGRPALEHCEILLGWVGETAGRYRVEAWGCGIGSHSRHLRSKEITRRSEAMSDFGYRRQSQDLAHLCMKLVREGNDFPTIWTTMLRDNPLVTGIPESKHDGSRPVLEIHLITGEKLVFDGGSKNFSLE